ncbi:glycosyltransferase [Alteromonadaceae bacterium BrNp21-10]|nr:glycosyltransferase [Alteromonadaceae bacterium BrNp21-10]
MKVIVTCEFRFMRTADGQVWTTSAFPYFFWQRYLSVFDEVQIVARIQDVATRDAGWQRVTGDRVTARGLPYYVGLSGLLKNLFSTYRQLAAILANAEAVIFRVPSPIAMLGILAKPKGNFAYALELVGDPYDVFQSGIVNQFSDKCIGWLTMKSLQRLVKKAIAVSYVTQHYLQQRYPASGLTYTAACSSIELKPEKIRPEPRQYTEPARQLVFIGSFGQLYKGPDLLIQALKILKDNGAEYQLTMLGGGAFLESMQQLADSLGVESQIHFAGEVAAAQVNDYLAKAEVFIMPSRTEGLPRAMIEAMADGLPCIGSKVGGIPELLEPHWLIENENSQMLADKIQQLCESVTLLNQQSQRNLGVASEYEASLLAKRRQAFYQHIKNETAERL